MNAYDAYMKEIAQQMRGELTQNGFTSLETSEAVSEYMNQVNADDTTFVVINSTCGCAAGLARPAAVAVATQMNIDLQIQLQFLLGKIKKQLLQCENSFSKHHLVLRMLYSKVKI
ncbi:hypothetical protein FORC61_1261 [Staphylococcus aureus]|nr:hypothetical protein FORC61_1261 [Staphylococcus aureus]